MIIEHRSYWPAFNLCDYWPDQGPACIYTLLSVNEAVGDCAAYRAIGPLKADAALIEKMKGGGNKISEREARELFPEIDDMKLRYRR